MISMPKLRLTSNGFKMSMDIQKMELDLLKGPVSNFQSIFLLMPMMGLPNWVCLIISNTL